MLEYRGFFSEVEYDAQRELYVGKVIGVKHPVIFESPTRRFLQEEFEKVLDSYLAYIQRRELGESCD